MALSADGSWNGNVMSAFSANRRRILSLWLPRLPIDRIKRQLAKRFQAKWVPVRVKKTRPKKVFASRRIGLQATLPASSSPSKTTRCRFLRSTMRPRVSAFRSACRSPMPAPSAPQLTVFDADEAADAQTLNDIADWCDRFTPLVALDPPHGLFLDITGCAHLFGGEAALMQAAVRRADRGRVLPSAPRLPAPRSARGR